MKKLGNNIQGLIVALSADSEQARINLRAHQVRDRYRKAIETVYRAKAELFLDHTNNVYIMMKEGVKTLIVYVDESIFAAELNAQRELIKLKLLELFGEEIEEFKIYVSRGKYRNYHPYSDESAETAGTKRVVPLSKLSETDRKTVESTASIVEDECLRRSFEKAMTANLAREIAENGNKTQK